MGFDTGIFNTFDQDWALLTAGPLGHFNTMTVSWGGLGTLWGLPVATVYVRTSRYTHEFLDAYDQFTLSFFPEEYRKDLGILGSKSGRDCNKIALTGLTPKELGQTVTFDQAVQTVLCTKIYKQDMDPGAIPPDVIEKYYRTDANHTIYIGRVDRVL